MIIIIFDKAQFTKKIFNIQKKYEILIDSNHLDLAIVNNVITNIVLNHKKEFFKLNNYIVVSQYRCGLLYSLSYNDPNDFYIKNIPIVEINYNKENEIKYHVNGQLYKYEDFIKILNIMNLNIFLSLKGNNI